MRRVSIIVFGSPDVITPYTSLASTLNDAGFEVRILTNIEHGSFLNTSRTFVHVPVYRGDAVQRLLQSDTSKDFVTLMRNMSMEIQQLVKHDSRLQVAMAKCNSDEFMTHLQIMKLSQELSNYVLYDLHSHPPDMLIAGHHGEYFGSYVKHILEKPSISLLLNDEAKISSFPHSWINLDNAVSSLGFPNLASLFHNKTFNVSLMNEELGKFSTLALDPDFSVEHPEAMKNFVEILEDLLIDHAWRESNTIEEAHEIGPTSLQRTSA